jgi:hypothetical protein
MNSLDGLLAALLRADPEGRIDPGLVRLAWMLIVASHANRAPRCGVLARRGRPPLSVLLLVLLEVADRDYSERC